ncbi:hypothetical protein PG996_011927 [Apiospora saccharicola]|uniref:Uncharacterized protein n=1 Tax=Apiospora saccharicola TaxID=335842 RepID=A0ABR1U3B2_9PEZI
MSGKGASNPHHADRSLGSAGQEYARIKGPHEQRERLNTDNDLCEPRGSSSEEEMGSFNAC